MTFEHVEGQFGLALIGTFDRDAFVEMIDKWCFHIGAWPLAVVTSRSYAGVANYYCATLVLKGIQRDLSAQLT